jgi:hypothetical protein
MTVDRRYQPNALELAATALIRLASVPGKLRRLLQP